MESIGREIKQQRSFDFVKSEFSIKEITIGKARDEIRCFPKELNISKKEFCYFIEL